MSNLPSALSKPSMVARMPGAPEVLESRIALSTFLVTTLADTSDAANDTGSLRDALFNAANHPGPDIIKFAPNLAGTITLTNGALPLILDPLTITGPGPGKISIDARHNSGIFVISDGTPSTDSPVTISPHESHYNR